MLRVQNSNTHYKILMCLHIFPIILRNVTAEHKFETSVISSNVRDDDASEEDEKMWRYDDYWLTELSDAFHGCILLREYE